MNYFAGPVGSHASRTEPRQANQSLAVFDKGIVMNTVHCGSFSLFVTLILLTRATVGPN